MENRSIFELIKSGFWFGFGLIVPLAIGVMAATYLAYQVVYHQTEELYTDTYSDYLEGGDTSKIVLGKYRQTMQGKQLLISGAFTNSNETSVSSLEIEAELFDKNGTFIYECSESIYRSIEAGAVENYQIKCGCSENGLPEFDSVKLTVVKVN